MYSKMPLCLSKFMNVTLFQTHFILSWLPNFSQVIWSLRPWYTIYRSRYLIVSYFLLNNLEQKGSMEKYIQLCCITKHFENTSSHNRHTRCSGGAGGHSKIRRPEGCHQLIFDNFHRINMITLYPCSMTSVEESRAQTHLDPPFSHSVQQHVQRYPLPKKKPVSRVNSIVPTEREH